MTHIIDLHKHKGLIFSGFALAFAFIVSVNTVSAQTTAFAPQTQSELVAYLQGVVDTLRAQIAAKDGTSSGSTRVSNYAANVAVTTKVELKSQFQARNNATVYAWFEYGEGSRLNNQTTRTKATGTGTTRTHTRTITGLKSGTTYSYRPVYEISGGTKYYGSVRTFSTAKLGTSNPSSGNSNNNNDDDNDSGGTSVSSSKGSISTDKTTYEPYKSIEVDWTVPSSKTDTDNWIGLFKTSDSNSEYQSWRYLADDTRGTLTFTAPSEGTYEFRLFYNNSDRDELTSRRITVRD